MFRVIKAFADLQDGNFVYNENDIYPRKGLIVSKSRIKELASDKNRRGVPLIVEISDAEEKPKKKKTDK